MAKKTPTMNWVTVKVPKELKDTIEKYINDHPEIGIGNFTDFTKRAISEKFENIKYDKMDWEQELKEAIEKIRIAEKKNTFEFENMVKRVKRIEKHLKIDSDLLDSL